MEVTQTGTCTELGKIATTLSEHVEEDTPSRCALRVQQDADLYRRHLYRGDLTGRSVDGSRVLRYAPHLHNPGDCRRSRGLLIAVTVILVLGMRKILSATA